MLPPGVLLSVSGVARLLAHQPLLIAIALASAGCDVVFELNGPTTDAASTGDGPGFDANLVFITNGVHDGNLGGLTGADAMCRTAALNAGLEGDFVAWISDMTTDAIGRLSGSRGWIRLDGQPVADLPVELGSRGPIYPITLSETGTDVRPAGAGTWTGTSANGSREPTRTCNAWTVGDGSEFARIGDGGSGGGAFSALTDIPCNMPQRLFCFGLGKTTEVFATPVDGPLAFVLQQVWSPTSGIAAADALCMSEATAAGRTATFRAALAPLGATVASRFPSSPSYVRSDGLRIGPLLTSTSLEVPPSLTISGALTDGLGVWTGGFAGTVALSNASCGDWMNPAETGRLGNAFATNGRVFDVQAFIACTQALHVYCLEVVP